MNISIVVRVQAQVQSEVRARDNHRPRTRRDIPRSCNATGEIDDGSTVRERSVGDGLTTSLRGEAEADSSAGLDELGRTTLGVDWTGRSEGQEGEEGDESCGEHVVMAACVEK